MITRFYSAADVRKVHEEAKDYLLRAIKEASEAAGGDENLVKMIGWDFSRYQRDLRNGSFSGMLRILEAIEGRNK